MSQEQEQIAYKYLKLINPTVAENAYEIKAEAPVFVSPDVNGGECKICKVHYDPLIYQVGYETRAHHFHGHAPGGIYIRRNRGFPEGEYWLATLIPLGQVNEDLLRAEAVRITAIRASCFFHGEELNNGIVVLTTNATITGYGMIPVCYNIAEQYKNNVGWYDKWHFQIRDGTVSFRPV